MYLKHVYQYNMLSVFMSFILIYEVCSSEIRFTKVYDNNLWLDKVSRSGIGSNPSSDAVKMDTAALDVFLIISTPLKY